MGIDRPEDPDDPPDRPAGQRDDQGGGGRSGRAGGPPPETRPRQEYYDELRVAESAAKSVTAQQAAAREQAAAQKWDEDSKESRWMWGEYRRKWPPAERAPVEKPDDPRGCWRKGDRYMAPDVNGRAEAECDRVAVREEYTITPRLRAVESQDTNRHLVGFDFRLKGRDRIKEKIHRSIKNFGRSPEEAISRVPDTIRYTFQYQESRYTQGVVADIARLKEQGFKLDKVKNFWSDEQYKGINSQWIEPGTGQRFEVQFHSRISFEAKQLTHDAYERLRAPQPNKPDKFEQMVLEAFQKKVTAEVPVPPSADAIPDYPERGTDAR